MPDAAARTVSRGFGTTLSLAAAAALAPAIFAVDTFVRLEFAVAVLYVVVVLLVAATGRRAAVVAAASVSAALALTSWLAMHRLMGPDDATLRLAVGLAAIAVTTLLALRGIAAAERLAVVQRQRANLARFLAPELVDELAELDTPLSVVRNRPAAVLFADVVGFTGFCARVTPEEAIAFLRTLHAALSDCVFAHGGTIDKFLGDGLIAVFGLPRGTDADAANAALCAAAIQRRVAGLAADGAAPVRVAVGIHYGPVVQGDIGGESRLELTVVGDTVNVASRVEAYCRVVDADVLVTDAVVAALHAEGRDDLAAGFDDKGFHTLRGRDEPVRLFGMRRAGEAAARPPALATVHNASRAGAPGRR